MVPNIKHGKIAEQTNQSASKVGLTYFFLNVLCIKFICMVYMLFNFRWNFAKKDLWILFLVSFN